MAWDIDVKCKVYQLLANEIFFRINDGRYRLGERLPTFQVIAKEAGSSIGTVQRAVKELQQYGIIEKTRYGYFATSSQENIENYRKIYLEAIYSNYEAAKKKVLGKKND